VLDTSVFFFLVFKPPVFRVPNTRFESTTERMERSAVKVYNAALT
jgi:hypothetical protein